MDTTVTTASSAAAMSMFDGDALLFYCLEASGYVYSEPVSSESNLVTVYPSKENLPHFPNIDFAAFLISHGKLQSVNHQSYASHCHDDIITENAEPMTVVYGSIIKIQHQASGRYLAVTPNNSAWLDKGNSEASLFRLVPSHQEKGWGDDLAINDNIKLESIYYKGYRIQCVNNPLEASYHLVLSVTGSIFSIKSHCYKRSTLNPQYLRGGNVIMLSSLKIDGYVSVKGSFVNDKLPDQFKRTQNEVGLRRWRQGFFKILPFSGDTFFQLEKTTHILTGNPIVFGEQCRIKHLPTQQYISVKDTLDGLKLVVESIKEANGAELFKILPIDIAPQEKVCVRDKVALQHVNSQKFLGVNVKPILKKRHLSQQDHLSQWFSLVLDDKKDDSIPVPVTSQYEILKAEDDAVLDIYHVTGLSSCLCYNLKRVSLFTTEDELDSKRVLQVSSFYQDVMTQMTGLKVAFNVSSNKKRLANMLRTLQTIDAMIALLLKMASGTSSPLKHQACCSICSALEEYVENSNFKSRHYLAKKELLKSLMTTVGKGFGTEKILIALSKDDVEIGDLLQEFIISFIETLNTEDSKVAELMTALAFSGRKFNKEIQTQIYRRTLATGMVHNFQTNPNVQEILSGFVEAVGCYFEKFGIVIKRRSFTYNYLELSVKPNEKFEFIVDDEHKNHILSMKKSLHQFLSTEEMHLLYTGDDYKGRNSILAQVLGILVFLVDYGVYNTDDEVLEIVHLLISIIDSKSDANSLGNVLEYHERVSSDTPGNKIVFKIKFLALQSLSLLLQQHYHSSVKALLYDFKHLRGKGEELYISKDHFQENTEVIGSIEEENISSKDTVERDVLHCNVRSSFRKISDDQIELEEIAILSKEESEFTEPPSNMEILLDNEDSPTEKLCTESLARLKYNFKSQVYSIFDIDSTNCQELSSILLDLISYDDSDVCLLSANILFEIFEVENILLSKAKDAYFTTPYTNPKIHKEMKELSSMTDSHQLLKQMLRNQIQDKQKLLNKLDELSNCFISSNDESEPDSSNQGVAYSCGLFNVLMEFVLEYGILDESQCHEDVLSSCFTLLQKITRKNIRAQNKLFVSFNDFIEIKTAVASMTCLLSEVFSNNPSLCKRLSENDIRKLFFISISSSNPEHYELTVTLQTIIQNTEPATPLQEYVSQLFLHHWQDNLGHILGQENQTNRFQLLENADDEDPHLQLLLNITDLLASCTVGECQSAESVSQHFYDIDELLLILVNEKIVSHRKLPFVRLLTWTFLNTERDSALACSQLASSRNFLLHIEQQVSHIDEEILKEIYALTAEKKKALQTKMKNLTQSNWSINRWIKYLADIPVNLCSSLLFVVEGILPMLSGFCYEMSLHLSGGNELCTGILTSKDVNVIKEVGEKLLALHRLEIICASSHIKILRLCVTNIMQFCETLHEPCSFNQLVIYSLNRARTVSLAPYVSNPEVTLNQDLQAYLVKYSNAYNESSSEVQKSLVIPNDPSFVKLIDLFSDNDESLRMDADSLKVKKLILILRNLIQKQRKQGLPILERINLEGLTLITLKLLCGVIFKRIIRVPRSTLNLEEFQQQYEQIIQPIQTVLLNNEIVETFIDLLHHPKDDIAFQVLACLNVLLYPGNEEAQKRITLHVKQQDKSLFVRVHQILRRAQSSLNKAKMGNAMAQIAALIPAEDDHDSSLSIKLMERNKNRVFSSMSQSMDDLSANGSQVQLLSIRRRTAAIEGNDEGHGEAKLSIMGVRVSSAIEQNAKAEFIDHRITMALNVLSWLCDGQQKDMQDILRDDKTFSGSNIVSQVAFLLHGITENLNENNINVVQGAVQALIEMCAGNYSNQVIAFKGQVILSVETILQEDFSSATASKLLHQLKSSCIELLEVMLEETDENSPQLAQWMINHWNIATFLGAMFDLWQAYSAPFNISTREQLRNSVFRAYHVLRRISDYKGISVNKLVGYKKHSRKNPTSFDALFGESVYDAKRMWQYCQHWSRSIEVVYKAKSGKEILTRTYFPYDPHKHLNENEKDTIMLRIKRNTPQEKLTDLLKWTEAIRSAHEWKKKVKKSWKSYWLLWASTIRHFLLFWLTILINGIVLFSVRAPSDYNNDTCAVDGSCNSTSPLYFKPILKPDTPVWYYPVFYTLGIIHLILAFWMVLQYYAKHWTNIRFEILSIKKVMYKAKKGLLRRKYIYQFFRLLNKIFCCGKFRSKPPQPEKYFQIFFFSFEPLYRILFVILSLLGLAASGYFYCGCMIYLFLRNHVLKNILRAVRKSAVQLLTILILGLVVIYIYAVISFALIPNYFSDTNDEFCQTIFQCFVTITRLGLLDTIGSAIAIRPTEQYQPSFTLVAWRTIYDIIFFIVITTLGLNIVIAILVDRFSDLREEKDKIDDDNESRCFVCSIKKDLFEQYGLNFQKHWRIEHNVWNYIHFVLYLDTLHPNDHNALEKYVKERIPSKTNPAGIIEFFPMFKAKVLAGHDIHVNED